MLLLRFAAVLILLFTACPLPTLADDAEDATVFYAAGVQKQGTAMYAQSIDQHNAELAKAAEYFRKALLLNPNYFDALIHLANVEAEMKQWDKSLEHLEKALPLPGVSEINKLQTQQAIAYVKSQMSAATGAAVQRPYEPSTTTVSTPPVSSEPAVGADPEGAEPPVGPQETPTPTPNPSPTFTTPPISAGPMFMGWTKFVDPNENSFSLEVPAGWKTEGGLTRASAIDVRPWVRTIAPDASVCAFIGDGSICPATVPTATLYATGFRPGSKYMGGLVLNYIPARKFLDKYLAMKLKSQMPDMQIVREAYHPDIALSVNGPLGVGNSRSDCASIKVVGTAHGIPVVGYYICCTKLSVMAGTGMWWVTYLAGEVSTAQAENAGLAVLTHMVQTSQVDPNWRGNQQNTTWQVSQNYRASANAISKMITDRYWSQQAANDSFNQAYWNRQASQDHAANNFSDYMRGQQTVADPTTGTQYQVQQANEHWINPMGEIMGTTGGAPDTDWRQLNNVP